MTDVSGKSDAATINPPQLLERWAAVIEKLARPFAIIVTSFGAAVATVRIATAVAGDKLDFSAAAIFMGAIFTGVGALYGAKSWENAQTAKQSANVEVAKAQGPTQ